MNRFVYQSMAFCMSALALCAEPPAVGESPSPALEKKRQMAVAKLTGDQDSLQADVMEIIADQTNPEVIKMLKSCQQAMNESIDLLERHNTGAETLAAQSDVIERIYQAAKTKYSSELSEREAAGIMEMLKRMLDMESPEPNGEKQQGDSQGNEEDGGEQKGSTRGSTPGEGASGNDGSAGFTPSEGSGKSDPNAPKEQRTVPKSMGIGPAEMPEEFRETLEFYNKSLQN